LKNTGYNYEPWHYRYVGIENATIITAEKITFEEYHALYLTEQNYKLIHTPLNNNYKKKGINYEKKKI